MGTEKSDGIFNLTIPVVMAHPNLYEAKAFGSKGKETGAPKFSANFIFAPDSTDLAGMKALAAKLARERWPSISFAELKFPFTNGDKLAERRTAKTGGKTDGDYQRGKVILAARSKFEPALSGIENGKITDYDSPEARLRAKPKFYFGVEVLAQFNFDAYDGVGNNPSGVTAYLNKVFTTNKGVKLVSASSAAEAFKGYAGSVTNENPLAGGVPSGYGALSNEIPF